MHMSQEWSAAAWVPQGRGSLLWVCSGWSLCLSVHGAEGERGCAPGVPEQELGKQSREGVGTEEDSGDGGTCPSLRSSVGIFNHLSSW